MSQPNSTSLDALLSADIPARMQTVASALRKGLGPVGGRVVLAGAGVLGEATLKASRRAGLEVVAFADNNPAKAGAELGGVTVMSPSEAVNRFKDGALFVITVYTSEAIWAQFRRLGVEPISFTRLAWTFPDAFLPYYGVDDPRIIPQSAKEIRRLFEFWGDEASREEYLAQLHWRTTLDPEVLGGHCPAIDTLFAPDLIKFNDRESFVDCGAFEGDTITQFLGRTKGKFHCISAFEPDSLNYSKLEKLVGALPGSDPSRVHIFPNAVGSAPSRIRFDATGTVVSSLGAGDGWVDVVTLDSAADPFAPTFIKMDIEGAEPDALRGACHTIRAHQPILAVCLYHTTRCLWEIPLLIKEILPCYNLYLRRYSNDCWEQVCYAIPPHRSIAS